MMGGKLYYLFYKAIKTSRKGDQSFFNAFVGICFLEFMNLGSIFAIANHFLKYNIEKNLAINAGLSIFVIIIIFNYFNLWTRKEIIILSNEKMHYRYPRSVFWAIVIFSFSFFFLVLEYFVTIKVMGNVHSD